MPSAAVIGLAIYVLLQLAVGAYIAARGKVRTEDDFFVAGRRLPAVLVAFSVFATWFGAETCVGAAGAACEEGIHATSVEPFAYGVCLVLAGLLLAAPMWRLGVTTLADLFRKRFGPRVERLAAFVLLPSSVYWAAAQVRAFGQVLVASDVGIELEVAIAIAAVVAIVYTVLGGLLADVYTDAIQSVALVVGLIVAVIAAISCFDGGFAEWSAVAAERLEVTLAPRDADAPSMLAITEAWAIPILGSITAQEVLQRTMAARNPSAARIAGTSGGLMYLAIGLLPVLVGVVGPDLVERVPGLELPEDPEQLLPQFARATLPTALYVLFAGALVSAILSTIDSSLLVASSLVSRNVVLAGRDVPEKQRLLAARLGVIVFGILAWVLAQGSDGIYTLIEEASAFGSSGVFVAVFFGLFTRFGGARAAAAALAVGVVVYVALAHLFVDADIPVLATAPYVSAVVAATGAYIAGGLLDARSRQR